MPVVLEPEDYDRWMTYDVDRTDQVADLLAPAREDFFDFYPISTRVNSVANDGPELQERVDPAEAPPAQTRPAAKPARAAPAPAAGKQQLKLL